MQRPSLEETLCLSVGIEPDNFKPALIRKLIDGDIRKLWPTIQFLVRRHEQLCRKFDSHRLGTSVNPRELLAWLEKVDFEMHPEFLSHLRQYHSGDPRVIRSAAEPDQREIDKVAQLFTVMAIESYGYRPDQSRSRIPKEIADSAASLGLSISTDTIRKYLRIGVPTRRLRSGLGTIL